MDLIRVEIENDNKIYRETEAALSDLKNLVQSIEVQWPHIFAKLYSFTTKLFANLDSGGKLIMYGNGGSAADCDHIVGEFRGRFIMNRPSVEAISLADSVATITAIGNDFGYSHVFTHQLDGIVKPYDSIIVLSTSGTSKNIAWSLSGVNRRYPDLNSMMITSQQSIFENSYKHLIQLPIECEKNTVARIQEMTMFLLHTMCLIFDNLYKSNEQRV